MNRPEPVSWNLRKSLRLETSSKSAKRSSVRKTSKNLNVNSDENGVKSSPRGKTIVMSTWIDETRQSSLKISAHTPPERITVALSTDHLPKSSRNQYRIPKQTTCVSWETKNRRNSATNSSSSVLTRKQRRQSRTLTKWMRRFPLRKTRPCISATSNELRSILISTTCRRSLPTMRNCLPSSDSTRSIATSTHCARYKRNRVK